jgi:hypothetical protein
MATLPLYSDVCASATHREELGQLTDCNVSQLGGDCPHVVVGSLLQVFPPSLL